MKNARLVAWGLIVSVGSAGLAGVGMLAEEPTYTLAGLGMILFGIWAAVLLFQNAE